MANMPRYGGQKVMPDNFPGVRAAETPGLEVFGGGRPVEAMRETASGLAGMAADIQAKEIEVANQAFITDASNRASAAKESAIFGEGGVVSLKGKNALQSQEVFNNKWKPVEESLIAEAKNPAQQLYLKKELGRLKAEATQTMDRHIVVEPQRCRDNNDRTNAHGTRTLNCKAVLGTRALRRHAPPSFTATRQGGS